MRKRNVLFLLLVLVIGVHATFLAWRMGWISSLPLLGPSPKTETARNAPSAPPAPQKTDAERPSFDVVRAEPTGDVVMAGRAEPGWTVTVESSGSSVGTAVANDNGEWIIQPSKPLPQGEHSLALKAQPSAGGRTLFSRQRLMLSLATSGKDQPLVALTEEGKAPRVLQMPPGAQALSAADIAALAKAQGGTGAQSRQVTFASIDYEEAGAKGMVRINGYAAPGMQVALYIDNAPIGTATADAAGMWTFAASRELSSGSHDMRADALEKPSGKVVARAEVSFDREPPRAVAADAESPRNAAAVAGNSAPDAEHPNAEPATPDAPEAGGGAGTGSRSSRKHRKGGSGAIIVRRGDTLWQIAQRYYGDGEKYTQIFHNNQGQIRNPDLIYPNQRFTLPKE